MNTPSFISIASSSFDPLTQNQCQYEIDGDYLSKSRLNTIHSDELILP